MGKAKTRIFRGDSRIKDQNFFPLKYVREPLTYYAIGAFEMQSESSDFVLQQTIGHLHNACCFKSLYNLGMQ